MKRIGITADCACDLPDEYIEQHDVGVMYFYITTDTGRFRDGYDVDSRNIIDYFRKGGKKAETEAPQPMEYELFFEKQLEKYDEIVHIAISDKLSRSYGNALSALEYMGRDAKRVTVIDSKQYSSGMAFMMLEAVEMRDKGCSAAEISEHCRSLCSRISNSFIACDADRLYSNGLTGRTMKTVCSTKMIHPVLTLRDGQVMLKSFQIGKYGSSVRNYIRSELKCDRTIDHRRVFITHAGCGMEMLAAVKNEVKNLSHFDEIIVTSATAAILSDCGAGSIGVLFLRRYS